MSKTVRGTRCLILVAALLVLSSLVASTAQAGTGHGAGAGTTEITCTHVTFSYSGFANAEDNVVTQTIKFGAQTISTTSFSFDGPSGTDTVPFSAPTGEYIIDAHATWSTNGVTGNFDHHKSLYCKPSFSIEKLQEVQGSGLGYTKLPLSAAVGQTVDYEILVTNTGNMPLSFASLLDAHCDEGTISGGPGESPLAPGESSAYTCTHVLTAAGSYTNVASDTATPTSGAPITNTSNTVVVDVPAEPSFSIEKLQEIQGSGAGFTKLPVIGRAGQTDDYEIVVTNTGNVALTFAGFVDPRCDGGTLAGGPGASPLAPGESSAYTCDHVLTSKDQKAGSYSNSAKVTATVAPEFHHSPITNTSNTVVVNFPGHGSGEGTTEIGCSQVTFFYNGFPNAEGNTVTQTIKDGGTVISTTSYVFNGPSGSDTVVFEPVAGVDTIDAHATWSTNGVSGNFDHHLKLTCEAGATDEAAPGPFG